MVGGRGSKQLKYKADKALIIVLSGFIVFAGLCLSTASAHAESVTLSKPSPGPKIQPFQMRTASRAHRGIDYGDKCPTTLPTKKPITKCDTQSGYGSVAYVGHACGVEEFYAHLKQCNQGSSSLVACGKKGVPGSGNSEATHGHLHYEIRINGCHVDPEKAFGKNLCEESVKKELLADAKRTLGSFAKCSATAGGITNKDNNGGGDTGGGDGGSTAPTPAGSGGEYKSVTQVDPGEVDPNTGAINNTDYSYLSIKTFDGQTIRQIDYGSEENTSPILNDSKNDGFTQPANSSNEQTGCSTDTWKAMVNQSVLQTRRETMYNARYIAKGDSVLAYSCFSDQAKLVGEHLGPVFSESKKWVNRQVDIMGKTVTVNFETGEDSLDGAINTIALKAYENFLQSFNHGFLGGMAGGVNGGSSESNEGEALQAYAPCGMMAQIWNVAKCTNVTDTVPFRRFDELIDRNSDPRQYPKNMKCMNTGITQQMIDIAQQKEVKFDKVDTYFDKLLPSGNNCAQAIKTGVIVHIQKGAGQISSQETYADGLCITAGCSYQSDGGDGECKVKSP